MIGKYGIPSTIKGQSIRSLLQKWITTNARAIVAYSVTVVLRFLYRSYTVLWHFIFRTTFTVSGQSSVVTVDLSFCCNHQASKRVRTGSLPLVRFWYQPGDDPHLCICRYAGYLGFRLPRPATRSSQSAFTTPPKFPSVDHHALVSCTQRSIAPSYLAQLEPNRV